MIFTDHTITQTIMQMRIVIIKI